MPFSSTSAKVFGSRIVRAIFNSLIHNFFHFLHREIGNGTLNGTQFNGNKRKQLEFVNVISTNQVVSVLYYCIQIYLKLLKFGTRFGTREPTCANFFGTY